MPEALSTTAAAVLALTLAGAASSTETVQRPDWPDTVVSIESLRTLTPFKLTAPRLVTRGTVRGPSIVRAHVDSGGAVLKVMLVESCGNPDLDEAVLRSLRAVRFAPYTHGGVPTEVSLVVPVHVPKHLGRSD
jgi:TonB family protein